MESDVDLGIGGKTALVCASSQGLGRGCAAALAAAGARVIINGRDAERLERVAREIADATGATVIPVAADVGTQDGRDALLAAAGSVDILVNNNGGPPAADFLTLDHDKLLAGVEANMLTPILLAQAVIPGMIERRFGRIVNITSGSVKMPLQGLDLSSGARLGLTGFLAGVARQVAYANVTINGLLPGAFDTARIHALIAKRAAETGLSHEEIAAQRRDGIPAKRFGQPDEFGAACAFLCSAQAGYITGQNILIDGGAFPGVL
jgi:3-oxoacyl-[acyl-carrier protein] reductase